MVMQIEAAEILGEFILTRSPELREKIVLQSVPLVHYLLGRMGLTREMGRDYEDFAHQGLIGLIDAIDNFDPDLSSRFSTYASFRIRGKILDYLRDADWMSRTTRKRTHQIQKTITTLWSENPREPTEEEIAVRLGLTVEEVRQGLEDSNRELVSLDALMESNETSKGSIYDYLQDENQIDPSEALEKESLIQEMVESLQDLPERERLI